MREHRAPLRTFAITMSAAVFLLLAGVAVGAPSGQAAVEDTTPPVVKLDRSLHFVVGATLSDSTSAPVVSKVNWKWRQSDPSGICDEYGGLDYYPEGADATEPETWFSGVRTNWSFPAHVDRAFIPSITATDCVGNQTPYADWWDVPDLPWYGLALRQEDAARYSAGWTTGSCKCWSGGTIMRTSKAGQTATFTESFRDFGLVTTRGPGRGTADIYVDGVKRGSINDTASTTTNRRVSFRVNTPGEVTEHTVVVRVTSGRIDIDAFLLS